MDPCVKHPWGIDESESWTPCPWCRIEELEEEIKNKTVAAYEIGIAHGQSERARLTFLLGKVEVSVRSDAYAASFQTMGQYRTALLKMIMEGK